MFKYLSNDGCWRHSWRNMVAYRSLCGTEVPVCSSTGATFPGDHYYALTMFPDLQETFSIDPWQTYLDQASSEHGTSWTHSSRNQQATIALLHVRLGKRRRCQFGWSLVYLCATNKEDMAEFTFSIVAPKCRRDPRSRIRLTRQISLDDTVYWHLQG